jgi:alcohol dehydrogenase class IV
VPEGDVDELSAALLDELPDAPMIAALGGGRVIDTAKALSAARGVRSGAVPTTLSAAEMTWIGQLPTGVDAQRRRPAVVVNDPDLSASQPIPDLAASAANSLGHAVEGPLTPRASPVPTLAAREAARLIDVAYLVEDEPPGANQRSQLALASLLSGYAIDSAGYGLHHVLSQTLRRVGGAGHGPANAVMLPHTIPVLERRFRGRVDPDGGLTELARRLARLAGTERIRDLGVPEDRLDALVEAAAGRAELDATAPRADADELRSLYEAAW